MTDLVAEVFQAQRERLRAVAYRVLGSHADAEDVVQEAWLRLARQDPASIDNLAGWLTTVVGRISLDVLRSRKSHEERLPDLVVTVDEHRTPEEAAALADSVGLALLVVLDSLGPNERLAFVLHDVFAVPFEEIGRILGKSTEAARTLASRARRKVQSTERSAGTRAERRSVADAFRAAASSGDFAALLELLDPDVKRTVHGPAGPVVTLGATAVATGARAFGTANLRHQPVLVNGRPGFLAWTAADAPVSMIAFTVDGGLITEIDIFTDAERLAELVNPA